MSRPLFVAGGLALLVACTPPAPPGPDTTAPQVALGLSVPLNQSLPGVVNLRAEASDNTGVTQVSFYLGDRLLAVDDTAPFETSDTVSASGQYRYRAVAQDAAGHRAEALLDVTIVVPTGGRGLAGTVADYARMADSGLVTTPWSGGAGTLTVTVQGASVASTALNTNGKFSLTLPETLPEGQLSALTPELLGAQTCQSAPLFSATGVRGALAQVRVQANASGVVTPLLGKTTSVNGVPKEWYTAAGLLLYAERALNVSGTARCQLLNREADVIFNVSLLPGWNKLSTDLRINSGGMIMAEVRSGGFPTETWVYGVMPRDIVRPLPKP